MYSAHKINIFILIMPLKWLFRLKTEISNTFSCTKILPFREIKLEKMLHNASHQTSNLKGGLLEAMFIFRCVWFFPILSPCNRIISNFSLHSKLISNSMSEDCMFWLLKLLIMKASSFEDFSRVEWMSFNLLDFRIFHCSTKSSENVSLWRHTWFLVAVLLQL